MFDLTTLVRTNILALEPYSSARDEFSGSEGIFMDANENPFGELNRYPDPLQKQLKQKLAEVKSVLPENIFTGNGSDEAIDLCFRIFCEPGKDKALTFTPTYGMYEVAAAINNVQFLNEPLNQDFQIEERRLPELLKDKQLKLIFICSPNNPTGNTIKATEYIIQNFKGIVVVDEAYADFCEASLTEKLSRYPNLIILQTLSKAWGLAGIRIGMAIASKQIINLFNKVKPPYNISVLNYNAALQVVSQKEVYETRKNILIAEREKLAIALGNLPVIKRIYPSEANFLLVEVSDANKVYNTLSGQNIIIRNRDKVVKNCLRISVGTPDENKALLTVLKNIES